MSLFIALALVLLLLVTTLLFRPLWQRPDDTTPRPTDSAPALRILREQRAELDAELAAGRIDPEAHTRALAELEARALEESTPATAAPPRPRRAWAIGLAVLLPSLSVALYLSLGSIEGLDPRATTPSSAMQVDAMVAGLAERVRNNPDDLEGLEMLGRSYMVLGRYSEAESTFAQLAGKRPDAQAHADWADAVASRQNRSLEGEPERLLQKALALDPTNIKALALTGTLAFERGQFRQALDDWEKIAARVPADNEFGQTIASMIAEARQRAGLPPLAAQSAPAASPALRMQGSVQLAAALQGQAAPDDALFIYARPAAGGPPLAGMRYKVSDLPIRFDFSQSQLMMGSIDPAQPLIIGARISKQGNALPQPGDLQGLSGPVPIDVRDLTIEIKDIVK